MTDRPILFSAPMVRALLNGSKTQTRRLASSKPTARMDVGDRLWVREAFAYVGSLDPGWLIYRATYGECCRRHGFDEPVPNESEASWKPSIHMPRRLSRLTLTITEKRTMPLSWILEADARAEGLEPVRLDVGPPHWSDAQGGTFAYASHAYASLWNSLHKAPGTRWDDNPDVIALTFMVEQRNIDR